MKKLIILTILLIVLGCKDNSCSRDDYVLEALIEDVVYAKYKASLLPNHTAITSLVNMEYTKKLKLDLYVSENGHNAPLVVVFFGGGFLFGDKSDENPVKFCKEMVKRGFSCASVNYQTINIQNLTSLSPNLVDIGYRAALCGKAAVRFLSAEHENIYDGNNIVLAGFSSGAITALNTAFLNDDDDIENRTVQLKQRYGDLNRFGNDYKMKGKVIGVINIAGAVFSRDVIDKSDGVEFIFNFAGDRDRIISDSCSLPLSAFTQGYNRLLRHGQSALRDTPIDDWLRDQEVVTVCGAQEIDFKAQKIGIDNHLFLYTGSGHSLFTAQQTDNLMNTGVQIIDTISRYVCENY